MPKTEHTQQNMEQFLRETADFVRREFPGTVNEELAPQFISCDAEKGEYVCSFAIQPRHVNPNGVLHGGVIATVMDTAMGHLAHYYSDTIAPTMMMNVSYLRAVTMDQPLYVRVQMDKPGAAVGYLSAQAYHADAPDRLLVTASGTYYSVKR